MAINYYNKAIKLEANETYFSNRAACYIKLEDWSNGLKSCNDGLCLGESSSSTRMKLFWRKGVCEKNLGMMEAARESFNKGLVIDPGNKVLQEELATTDRLSRQVWRDTRARRMASVTAGRKTVPVKVVDSLPNEWNEQLINTSNNDEGQLLRLNSTFSDADTVIDVVSKAPLTLPILIQLVRTPQSQRTPVYNYLFNIDANRLVKIHGRAGIEHDTIEFFLDAISAKRRDTGDPVWAKQSINILSNLAICHRFSITHLFVSSDKIKRVFELLEKVSSKQELYQLEKQWM